MLIQIRRRLVWDAQHMVRASRDTDANSADPRRLTLRAVCGLGRLVAVMMTTSGRAIE